MNGLTLLIKPASGNCNLRCRYCFYADVSNKREQANLGMMSLDTLQQIVRRALDESEEWVSFGFQGGEPMLSGLPFYRELIAMQASHNHRGVRILNTIQTNGLLIDPEWAAFFAQNGFLVGLSIDGTKDAHDDNRLDPSGNGTHNRCLKAAALLTKAGAEFNVLSVVTRGFARHPDAAFSFYKRNGLRYVQMIPCLDGLDERHGAHPWSLDAETYGRFLCRFFDLWHQDYINGEYMSVRLFDNWIRMLAGQPPESCSLSGRCSCYGVIEADGSVYPCDFYVLDEYRLGNVREQTLESMLLGECAQRFIAPSQVVRHECAACEYAFICRAGCRRDREPLGDASAPPNVYCAAYKQFFAHALPRMARIANQLGATGNNRI